MNTKQALQYLPSRMQYIMLSVAQRLFPTGPFYSAYRALGCPDRVLSGLFCNSPLKYFDKSRNHFGNFLPQLCGTYEMELHEVLRALKQESWDAILDVGCAEGYYAIPFAAQFKATEVIAYDTDTFALNLARKNAVRANVANRLTLKSLCDHDALGQIGKKYHHTLLFVDIEGYEDQLLDPIKVPELARMAIVVEVHDQFVSGVGLRLKQRFGNTHMIEEIIARPRSLADWHININLSDEVKLFIMDERRGCIASWLYMRPLREI